MPAVADGVYRIEFTYEQVLTAIDARPGGRLVLLPPGAAPQDWDVRNVDGDAYTICLSGHPLFVSFDGAPDMHELALLQSERRLWQLVPGGEPGAFRIAVPDADMNLGMSLLRIYPPFIALAPNYGDPYQAWRLVPAG